MSNAARPVPMELLEALAAEADGPEQAAKPVNRKINGHSFNLDDFIRRHFPAAKEQSYKGGRRWQIDCPFNTDHHSPDAAIYEAAGGVLGFKCSHNSCSGKKWRDLREQFEPGCYDRRHEGNGDGQSGRAETVGKIAKAGAGCAKPFPSNILPEPLRSFITQAAAALGCDAAYIGVPLLPVVASAIGNTRRIRLKTTWSEPAVMWAATVGESGTVKSPALDLATRPVWRRQAKLLKTHAEKRADYNNDLQTWKDTPKKERGDRPEPPEACEHPLCNDITIEALADRLLSTPRGTLISLDELSAWFGSFNQYKSGGADVAHWLALHGARALKVDRKTGDRTTLYIPHAAVSVTGTIQPDTLRRVLLPEFFDNGLAARLLLAMPPTRAKQWTDHEIGDDLGRAVDDLFGALYELRPSPGPDGDEPLMVDLLPDALAAWIGFVDEHGETMDGLEGHARAAWAKLEGYAARFALIFHCVRQASGEKQLDYIDADDVRAGIELARWFGTETLRVYRAMHESDESRQRRTLLDLIHRLGGRVTPRALKEHCRRFSTSEDAELALNELVDEAMGSWEVVRTGGRGRPATVFVLADSPDRPARSVPLNQNSNGKSHFVEPERRNGDENDGPPMDVEYAQAMAAEAAERETGE